MIRYVIFITIITIGVKTFAQTDTLLKSKIVFLENKATLIEQIKEFEGSFVYIDTWATFCSPCIKWLIKKKEYEKFFEENDIVVICICFVRSDKKNNWKELIGKHSMTGYHLFVENEKTDDYLMDFNVSSKKSLGHGFPRFLIVDMNGKVVESFAYAPSKMLIEQLEKYLK